jgi:hypothetical protein
MGAIFTIYEEKMQGRSSRLSKITLWLSAILVGNFSKSNLHPKIIILHIIYHSSKAFGYQPIHLNPKKILKFISRKYFYVNNLLKLFLSKTPLANIFECVRISS